MLMLERFLDLPAGIGRMRPRRGGEDERSGGPANGEHGTGDGPGEQAESLASGLRLPDPAPQCQLSAHARGSTR